MLGRFCRSVFTTCVPHCRFMVTLKRKYPLTSPSWMWADGVIPPLTVKQQIYEEVNAENTGSNLIEVLLTADVPGLGTTGSLVSIHRNRFWRFLYPLRMAKLPSPEGIAYVRQQIKDRSCILCGDAYESEQRLLNMTLYIPMNPAIEWTLCAKHVKVAFRKYVSPPLICSLFQGIVVNEDAINIPGKPITRATAASPFKVLVKVSFVFIQ
ncbi:large subunit ribosomal protein L9, partial [Paragonimus westermani]